MLLIDLAAWIENGSWRVDESRWRQPIGRFAGRALKKRLRKFVKSARNLGDLNPEAQHKVRIRAKKLRYMAGFFKTAPKLVRGRKALRKLLERLEQIQNCLGEIHDEQARAEFLLDEARHLPPGADPMIAYAAGNLAPPAAGEDKRLKRAVEAYQLVVGSNPF
jgi:triphosphatase